MMPKLRESLSSEVREELEQLAEARKVRQARVRAPTEEVERVAVFVDGENLIPQSVINQGRRLHFRKLLQVLTAGRPVNSARWFDSYKDKAERERKERLYLALTLSGFTVRALPLRSGHKLKSQIDPHLQAEISERLLLEDRGEEPYTHTFILVSGDSDFYPMVELLKRHGRRVEVAYLGETLSHELRTAADRLIDIEERLGELTFTIAGHGRVAQAGDERRNSSNRRTQDEGEPGRPVWEDKFTDGEELNEQGRPPLLITVVPSRRTRLRRLLRRLIRLGRAR